MGLASIIANGIAKADRITADLQPNVLHEAWTGQDEFGTATYAAGVNRAAIVEKKTKLVTNNAGIEVKAETLISIIRPVLANGAAGRQEPIDPRDRFTLPDGSTGPVMAIEGLIDRTTGAPFYSQVWL
jgi:hypothetical protein